MWGPCFSGAPTGRHRLSPWKNHRDEEEQRAAGTMRSRLPRTACLLRLFALCILLAHSAAYFGSVSLGPRLPVNDSVVCFLFRQKATGAGQVYAHVILLVMRVCIMVFVFCLLLQTLIVNVFFHSVNDKWNFCACWNSTGYCFSK